MIMPMLSQPQKMPSITVVTTSVHDLAGYYFIQQQNKTVDPVQMNNSVTTYMSKVWDRILAAGNNHQSYTMMVKILQRADCLNDASTKTCQLPNS